ncbi:Hsp20/alpha crystallin family protein [Rhodovibrio sodomensis]|nr:Hsp20/alpha crystallin family protein [Rhodovibrio sodomensis]
MRRTLFPVTNTDLTNQTGRNVPFRDPFAALQTEMNRLFDDVWNGFGPPASNAEGVIAAPRVDLKEDDSNWYITAELPGMSEDDVEVTYDDGVLRIAGEKKQEHEDQGRNVHVTERAYGRFERQLPLGHGVKEEQIDASFKDGVLTITAPKAAEKEQTKRISVKRAA